jgi:hypothetical protein
MISKGHFDLSLEQLYKVFQFTSWITLQAAVIPAVKKKKIWWNYNLNSGLYVCRASALQLEPHFQAHLQ